MCTTLLVGFSPIANAETITGFEIRQDVYLIDKDNDIAWEYFETFKPNNSAQTYWEHVNDYYTVGEVRTMQLKHRTVWNIFAPKSGYPFEVNKTNRVELENFYYRYLIEDSSIYYVRDYESIYVVITYADNSTERVEVEIYADTDNGLDINFEFVPTQNVLRFDVYVDSNLHEYLRGSNSDDCYITSYFGEINGDNKHNFNIEYATEEEKLLGGILGWVQNIFNKIGDMFNAIIELPAKIWEKISDGLKALFIPTEADMTEFSDKMDGLLERKLGAVYQVSNTVFESWDRIQEADEQNTISFPEATISLPDDNEFTFGGYEVKIVPDGFEWLATAFKSLAGIVCTIAFINGLRKRYDETLGG